MIFIALILKEMNLTEIQGKCYPQRIILDSNIQTVTGELFSVGTEIVVFLCEKLILCRDCRDYCNVTEEATQTIPVSERIFLNPACEENLLDTHCKDEFYETVDDLCRERPRFFTCEKEFFTICNNDRTVKVRKGYELELNEVKSINVSFIDTEQAESVLYTNVDPSTKKTCNVIHCHCKDVGCDLQISSNIHNSKFKALEDQTHYKPKELLDRFPLPRQVAFIDENLQKLGLPFLSSTELSIESENKMWSLLFTVDHRISELESGLEIKDRIKCCELINPSLVNIKNRIDNSNIGEEFKTAFVFESLRDKRPVFTLLGRKQKQVISRLKSGRQPYIGKLRQFGKM